MPADVLVGGGDGKAEKEGVRGAWDEGVDRAEARIKASIVNAVPAMPVRCKYRDERRRRSLSENSRGNQYRQE